MKIKKGDTSWSSPARTRARRARSSRPTRRPTRSLVEGVNRIKKHTKVTNQSGRGAKTGGIVTQEAPIHVTNVMLVDPATKTPGAGGLHRSTRTARRSAFCVRAGRKSDDARRGARAPVPRLKQQYRAEIAPALQEEFGYANVMQIPGLTKVVVNMGVGEAARDSKLIEGAVRDLAAITGQKPQVTKARKSIAQFKLREGMPIGAHVTLRGDRMWEFLDRLLAIALPRIRDFRGLTPRQFDGQGNYTFGLTEQVMFHEIDQDKIDRLRGMDITVVTTATTDDEGRALLRQLGFPFKETEHAGVKVKREVWGVGKGKRENGEEGADRQGEPQAEVRGAGLHPLQPVRPPALRLPQVRPVPDLPARDGAPRRTARRHQVQLVTTLYTP